MTTKGTTIELLTQHLGQNVTAKKMFGEYGLYFNGTLFGLVCDDRFYLKLTDAGKRLLPDAELAPPYERAKLAIVVTEDLWDDTALLKKLVRETVAALPHPKLKKK